MEVDSDILRMDQEDMVDEIMTLRISLRASVDEIKKVEAERDKYEKDAVYRCKDLKDARAALKESIEVIKIWHSIGEPPEISDGTWKIYLGSPEMRRLLSAIPKRLPTIEETGGSDPNFTGALSTEEYVWQMRNPTGFKRVAVMDEATCEICRERNGSLILDVGELTRDCMMDGGCRCVAVPV